MGLQTGRNTGDKLEYNNTVEESSDQRPAKSQLHVIDFCPHYYFQFYCSWYPQGTRLVPLCSSMCPKHSCSLIYCICTCTSGICFYRPSFCVYNAIIIQCKYIYYAHSRSSPWKCIFNVLLYYINQYWLYQLVLCSYFNINITVSDYAVMCPYIY